MSTHCPKCTGRYAKSSHTLSIVRVKLRTCTRCQHAESDCTLLVPFDIHEIVSEAEQLRKSSWSLTHTHVKHAITFMQTLADDHVRDFPKHAAVTRQRKLDLYERQFLKQATSE